jgi:hypothetical protein
MRFFHGTHLVRLWLEEARVLRGGDFFSRSEFYLGVSIKPRYVDFELFHQSAEAENCYGPFHDWILSDNLPDLQTALRQPLAGSGDPTNGWAGPDRLVWEGWVDARAQPANPQDMVFRVDIYLGERDSFGVGFSDNVVFRKQYYIQAVVEPGPLALFVHTGEQYLGTKEPADRLELERLAQASAEAAVQRAQSTGRPGEWTFQTKGTGLAATWRVAIETEPDAESP